MARGTEVGEAVSTPKISESALRLYAKGVELCSERGVSIRYLRVYEYGAVRVRRQSYKQAVQFQFNGTEWNVVAGMSLPHWHILATLHGGGLVYRSGAWVEFESLDAAKEAGFKKTATKLCGPLPDHKVFSAEWIAKLVWNTQKQQWVHPTYKGKIPKDFGALQTINK